MLSTLKLQAIDSLWQEHGFLASGARSWGAALLVPGTTRIADGLTFLILPQGGREPCHGEEGTGKNSWVLPSIHRIQEGVVCTSIIGQPTIGVWLPGNRGGSGAV